jgi:hypothetical protein
MILKNSIFLFACYSFLISTASAQLSGKDLGTQLARCAGNFGAVSISYEKLGQSEVAKGAMDMALLSADLSKKYIPKNSIDSVSASELRRVASMFSQNSGGGAVQAMDEFKQCMQLLRTLTTSN